MRFSLKTLLIVICLIGALLGLARWSPALACGILCGGLAMGSLWIGYRSGRRRWLALGGILLLVTPVASFPLMDYDYKWFGTGSLPFHVTDATTGKAVSGAQVAVLTEGTWEPEFAERYGRTDADGFAQAYSPQRGVGVNSYTSRDHEVIRFRGERVEVEAPGYVHYEIMLRDLVGLEVPRPPQSPIEVKLTPGKSAAELAPTDDLAALQGKWYVSHAFGQNFLHRGEYHFNDREMKYTHPTVSNSAIISIDNTVEPKVMRFHREVKDSHLSVLAIYRIDGHRMEICFAKPGQETPPSEFSNNAGEYSRLRRASTTIEVPIPVGKLSRFSD